MVESKQNGREQIQEGAQMAESKLEETDVVESKLVESKMGEGTSVRELEWKRANR